MTKLDAGLMTSLPASDSGSAAAWGSKRINTRPQFCLCLTWSGYPSNDDDDDEERNDNDDDDEERNCTNDKPPQRGGAVPFPALGRVEMACQFPEGLILGRFSLGQFFSFFIPAVQCAVTCGQHS